MTALELYVKEQKQHYKRMCKKYNYKPETFAPAEKALDRIMELWRVGLLCYREAIRAASEVRV